jgi:hypothetical protein
VNDRPGSTRVRAAAALVVVALLGALVSPGCASGPEVRTAFDPKTGFSHYRTFAVGSGRYFIGPDVKYPGDAVVHQRVASAVEEALRGRGLTPDNRRPDLVVAYTAGARRRVDEGQPVGHVVYRAPGLYGTAVPMTEPIENSPDWDAAGGGVRPREYTQGSLVLDLYDAGTGRLVWRAYATAEVTENSDGRQVREAVRKAFAEFPPKSKP